MISYKQYSEIPSDYLSKKINEFLEEDSAFNDRTTLITVPPDRKISGYIEAQSEFILCGVPIIQEIFKDLDDLQFFFIDGQKLNDGDIIARFSGNARYILSRERVMLNLIQRLSAIATMSNKFALKANGSHVKILDTRKTTPGIRLFEKYAVVCGGAANHRFGLSSGILIKDNHISAAGSIENALKMAKEQNEKLPIELEIDSIEQIKEAMAIGVDGFLLDNMNRQQTIEAVSLIRSYPNGSDIFIESSGGINYDNIDDYFGTGIDAISIGALTHSVKSVNIHLELEF